MTIKLMQSNKLQISLLEADLSDLGITYESLDYVNPKTREAVASLLQTAQVETGFTPGDGKLLIEVYPSEEGCILYFTALAQREAGNQHSCEPIVFEFLDVEFLLQGCCKLFQQHSHRIFRSTVYSMDGKYYLILYALDGAEGLTSNFLQEFSRKIARGRIADAFLEEHANCIAKNNAIDLLAHHFS